VSSGECSFELFDVNSDSHPHFPRS
jgi:hypothetical protein